MLPGTWQLVGEYHDQSGFDGSAFRDAAGPDLVMCAQGQNPFSIWDWRAMVQRRLPCRRDARYLPAGLNWMQDIAGEQSSDVTLVGHSGGGGYVSWAASQFAPPPETICFNSARVGDPVQRTWSFRNDGKRQRVVGIRGDKWSDPKVEPKLGPALPGAIKMLGCPKGFRHHFMETIIKALEAEQHGHSG